MKSLILVSFFLLGSCRIFGQDLFAMIPETSNYAVEFIPEKIIKIKKITEILDKNNDYAMFKATFTKKGIDFEKSMKKIVITGAYKREPLLIFDTTIKEKTFLSLMEEKKPEAFTISGKKVYKYFDKNKTMFSSFVKDGLLMISENPTLITDSKYVNFNKLMNEKFSGLDTKKSITRGYMRDIAKAMSSKKNKDSKSLLNHGAKECYFEISSSDGIVLDATAYILSEANSEKILQFQTNALFLLLTAKIASGNQKLANQITDSFKLSSQGEMVKVFFQIDSSLLDVAQQKTLNDEAPQTLLDPFTE